jgi:surface antigen Omp85-like protein
MRRIYLHHTTRGDPLSLMFILVLVLVLVPALARAQQGPSAAPADALARTAAQAVLAQDVPGDQVQTITPKARDSEPEGILPEPRFIFRGIRFATRTAGDGSQATNGFYPEFSNMPTGSGWISIGPGFRQFFNNDRVFIDASTAVSWRSYKMAQGRFELPKLAKSRVAVGTQLLWQDLTQVTYFGPGADSIEENRSEYRLKSTDIVGYGTYKPTERLAIGGRMGFLRHPTLLSPAGTFKRGNPDTLTMFADDPAIALETQPSYVHTEAFVTADTRDSRSHPANGGVYRAGIAIYTDRGAGTFNFERYEAEAVHFVSMFNEKLVLGGHGWLVGSNTGEGHMVPFYLMPSLGGGNTLRGYTDYRFHDRNLVVVSVESRVALLTHLDLAAFVDAGNVAPTMSDLNLDKRDWGVGVRMHSNRATFLRVDAAHGTDGWRIIFRTNDPFHLSRLSRRVAAVPFAP